MSSQFPTDESMRFFLTFGKSPNLSVAGCDRFRFSQTSVCRISSFQVETSPWS